MKPHYSHLASWKPGVSGNPLGAGRNKIRLAMQIRKISHDGREMIDLLFSVMRGEALPLPSPNGSKRDGRLARSSPELRVKAAEMLLDRAYGKAKETVPDAHVTR